MYQQPMVSDRGTQDEENLSSHHRGMHENGLTDGLMARWMDGETD